MSNERGFALLGALWLVVAISAVGLELSLQARDRRLTAANTLEATEARVAAEAGLEHARARLVRLLAGEMVGDRTWVGARSDDPWAAAPNVFSDTVAMGAQRYVVMLNDPGARLHLNRATETELTRLLRALRVDFGRAERVAQAIADWRDADDEHRPRGAERDHYERNHHPVLPRNGPFPLLAELRHVAGMDDALFDMLTPYLTLQGTGRVNLTAAPREVLLALGGLTEEAVAVIDRFRRQGRPLATLAEVRNEVSTRAAAAIDAHLPRLSARITFATREIEARVTGWTDGSPVRAEAHGLFVRARETVFLVFQRTS